VSTSIPAGWSWSNFSEVARIASNLVAPAEWPHLPHIAPDNIERDSGKLLPYRTVREDAVTSAKHRFYPGQLLYSKIRPYLNKCIRVGFEGLSSADMYPVDAFIYPGFLHHYMLTRLFVSEVSKAAGSRTILPKTNQQQMAGLPVPVAPLPEQHRIVEALDSYLSRLDAATAGLERVQVKLKAYRASVLKAAVEGRLVPTEASLARAEKRGFESAEVLLARILKERRRRWEEAELAKLKATRKTPKDDKWKMKYEQPIAPNTSKLANLPEGWCWATMDQLTTRITSGSRDWTKYYGRGSAVFLMAQNVRPGRLDLSFRQHIDPPVNDPSCERSQVELGDVLVTIVGANTGNVCRVSSELPGHYVCQSVALMRPVDAELSAFLSAYFNSPNGKSIYDQYMYGQGRPHLSFDQLRESPVALPPLAEQAAIASTVDDVDSLLAAALEGVGVDIARCSRLRQAILKWAFEGKLVDQDPNDEPADKLLARIRTERTATVPTKKSRGRAAKEPA
jgi:type I restriction enzyme S subunit